MVLSANLVWADGPVSSPSQPDKSLIRKWGTQIENAVPLTLSPTDDLVDVFSTYPVGNFVFPAGNYEFNAPLSVPAGSRIQMQQGAILVPTFKPVGSARVTPMIDFGAGVTVDRINLHLEAGINTVRKCVRLGDYSQVGLIEVTSADLNNNRTEPGSTDLISGAVLLNGQHIRIGQIFISRFDRGWTVIDSSDVVIGKIRNLETLMGGYVHGTRDMHILSGYTSGPSNPAEPNSFNYPRGIMTPGCNSVVLAGCSDSSISNWTTADVLEHGLRVGAVADGTSVPNHRLSFVNHRHLRPYGCGHKQDDGNDFNIKKIFISGLYTEDVGHNNWFGNVDYQNWSAGNVNNPTNNNDGNKTGCAIRNSQHVTVQGYSNKANLYASSGYFGLWFERSNYIQAANIDVEKARLDGFVIQSGGGTSPDRIEVRGVGSRENGGSGVVFDASPSNDVWRGVQVLGIDSQNNTEYGVKVTNNLGGSSPYATIASRIEGFVRGNTAGQLSIAVNVAADPDFVNEIKERGSFVPSASFATVGTSTWSYSVQSGRYWVDGDRCFVEISIAMTPTIGTGSGNLRIGGLPYPSNGGVNNINIVETDADFSSWNGRVELVPSVANANTLIEIRGLAAGAGTAPITATNMTSGAEHILKMVGWYRI